MKNIFALFFISFILFSCSRDDESTTISEEEYPLVTKLNVGLSNGYNSDNNFYFEYDNNNRLIKKNGGFLQLSGGTGFNDFFTDKLFTSLVYNNNKVTVENFSSSDEFNPQKETKYYFLNNNSQIIQKEIPFIYNHYQDKKQSFKYSNNQLIEINTTLPNMPYYPPDDYIETYLEKFYYDSKGNLTKSEYFEQRDGVNKGIKIIRTFGDYDNSLNPFKRFYLLDEYFYRAISKNNYRKYTEIKYNEIGQITSNIEQTWTFNYDSDGKIIIN
ncbi:hypothetical protein [Epilithonimonas sp.]|uniref:hypothetical protein n=1 Tax=Epilithonimonas sp. TaxID=2894511 RepID=UPI002FDE32B5